MNGPFIIALDQGTTNCRAFAVDQTGVVRAQHVKPLPPRRAGNTSEYTAEDLWAAQWEVLSGLLDEIGPEQAAALAVCSQRSTVVLWDKSTGKSVAPVLTWEDGRAQQETDRAPIDQQTVHARTGLFKTPYFSAPKIAWCLAHCPPAREAAAQGNLCAAPVASYFIWKLTQGNVFATDPALAQRTLLWDMHTRAWSEELCRVFGVPMACLPIVQPTAADYGTLIYKGRKIPLVVCAADQQAALAYHGLSAGETHINYGTGAFVLHHTGTQDVVLPGMLSSVTGEGHLLLEGPVFAAGSVLQWLQVQGLFPAAASVDEVCAASQHPVSFLPAFGGLGAPYWDYRVSPVIEGLSPHTCAADFVAGAVRGVAHLVADIADYLRQHGQPARRIYVSGGMARSEYLLQFQADLLQCPLSVYPETESTVLGTAGLAANYIGWDTQRWVPACWFISPRRSKQEIQILRAGWQQRMARVRQQSV